jgi:hypothetical protein
VRRVHHVLMHLQPVAGVGDVVGHEPVAGVLVGVVDRELGLQRGRAEVAEDQALVLVHRVGAMAEAVAQRGFGRVAGRLEDGAVHAVQPAVVAAAQAVLLADAELERAAAVTAVRLQQAGLAVLRAEQHQRLAEHAHLDRQLAQLGGQRHGLPEAAQVFAGRRAALDVSEIRVLGRRLLAFVGRIRFDQQDLVGHPWLRACPGGRAMRGIVGMAGGLDNSHDRCGEFRFSERQGSPAPDTDTRYLLNKFAASAPIKTTGRSTRERRRAAHQESSPWNT